MPTRIPIYRDEIFERLDKDKAELKKEMNDLALLILAKLEPYKEPPIDTSNTGGFLNSSGFPLKSKKK